MHVASSHFLAGARLAVQQHWVICLRKVTQHLAQRPHHCRVPHQLLATSELTGQRLMNDR